MKSRVIFATAAAVLLIVAGEFSSVHSRTFQTSGGPVATHGSWTVLNDCIYTRNSSNDGDSFHISAGGKQYLFRLYFVDAPETDADFKHRVDEQAKYFGIGRNQVVQVGKLARDFTREKLSRPFTLRTCFQDALGRSRMQRFYAIVQTATGDLGEQLIENGLARIHGASANPVGLPSANVEWQKLNQLEIAAKVEKVGGWGVNFGRMTARSEKSKSRVPVDPFEAFFHPERVQISRVAPPVATAGPFSHPSPAPATDEIVSINPTRGNTGSPRDESVQKADLEPVRPASLQRADQTSGSGKVDINTATEDQLEGIPGIGPVLSQRIIAARPFRSADDLRHVKGIGGTRYGKLRPFFN